MSSNSVVLRGIIRNYNYCCIVLHAITSYYKARAVSSVRFLIKSLLFVGRS